ncbi:MAG: radical SAM protein [Desulfobacterales bacterium]|uniref:Radical SAM protein n=1 Tax=Candidatus Desulfatibia profunda TaxID=2841695 RepID=A0A8J6NY64_9BACT|nr:radical SAM protein [Candidatus Desulfatibia profunda]MBL7180580.1 radical SAM protein [Desulfobacterales bacterium]MBU0698722.1 radical SAM protein [Pseudomonadota bacterium]
MTRPFIIPVFLPHYGCPHRCIFCNQTAITSRKQNFFLSETIFSWINEFLRHKGKQRHPVQIAFYGGNFLGLKTDDIKRLLTEATMFVTAGKVDSIRFSTRPDTINRRRLDIIKPFPVTTIEIGVQSMDDQVLAAAGRGHTATDTEKAVALLKERAYEIGLQMMVGLPGDNEAKSLATGRSLAELSPGFVRIYPTIVLANSPLAELYQNGAYRPWSLERCVTVVKNLYLLFKEKKIAVIRMGLQSSEDLDKGSTILAGPYHPAFGHLVHSEIFLDAATAAIRSEKSDREAIALKVHPQSISKMRGLNNQNVEILKKKFNIKSLQIVPDATLSPNRLVALA